MIEVIILAIALNIISQLYLIRKDHEKVLKADYIKFAIESLFIIICILMSWSILEFWKDLIYK